MRLFLLKWSRNLHKWLGIYVAVLTVVWVAELVLLPGMYAVQEVGAERTQAIPKAGSESVGNSAGVSFEEIRQRVHAGVYGTFSPDIEIAYVPREGKYIVRDRVSYAVSEVSAESGAQLGRHLDQSQLFADKSGLGWLNGTLSAVIKAPFEISFVILAVSGVYLIVFPWLRRKRAPREGLFDLAPGERFRFMGTSQPSDMARIASLGLLPGVSATVMRQPRRGPIVLSARNTRIAVGRAVASSFLFEKKEA